MRPQNPDKVTAAIKPDYSLGSHVAALGVDFSTPAMGERFADGVFVGEHGSWNRPNPVGYKVIFVPFSNGKPAGSRSTSPRAFAVRMARPVGDRLG